MALRILSGGSTDVAKDRTGWRMAGGEQRRNSGDTQLDRRSRNASHAWVVFVDVVDWLIHLVSSLLYGIRVAMRTAASPKPIHARHFASLGTASWRLLLLSTCLLLLAKPPKATTFFLPPSSGKGKVIAILEYSYYSYPPHRTELPSLMCRCIHHHHFPRQTLSLSTSLQETSVKHG